MQIVGYSDRLCVEPGEKIRFMVSTEHPTYRADLVRLVHGDENPDGPGFKEEHIESPINDRYTGRYQSLNIGSYVTVPDSPELRLTGNFTLQCWIYPTTPGSGAQGLLTKWSAGDGFGYGLVVDEDGGLALWLGDRGGSVERVSTGVSLRASQWYFVAATWDVSNHRATLYQEPITMWPSDGTHSVIESVMRVPTVAQTDAPLLMAGYWVRDESGNAIVQGHYNGKIESPRIFERALSPEEVASLRDGAPPQSLSAGLVAAWDFTRDFSSTRVTDTSPNGLHGLAVNMPARAMTGYGWRGEVVDFKQAPGEYGAIYFHDDDLEDAGWDVDFELTVPEDSRSGVYGARLRAGADGADYVPFFVRPKKGTSTAPILFLAPTNSYLAYGNLYALRSDDVREWYSRLAGRELPAYPDHPQDRYIVDNNLLSLYDVHSDGSGVAYSSRLRPILNMRPKYIYTILGLGAGPGAPHQFNADLHLLDWMEAKGYEYDVATDEDLHFDGAELLEPYRVLVTGSHPEYWSAQMLDAMETYLANGGRLMYLGGNGFYWVTSVAPGRPHVVEVRRWRGTETWEADPGEYYHSTTGEVGGLWRFRGRPPQKLTGVGFSAHGFDESLPYRRQPGSTDPRAAFIFEGVAEDEPIGDFGLVMGGAAGYEVDRADPELGTPPHALVVATASGFSDGYQHVVEEVLVSDSHQGGTVNPLVKADVVYFEGPKGGAVFSVGSIAWCGALSHNNYDNAASRVTENVLKRFTSGNPSS